MGMVTEEAIRITITVGVKGGIRAMVVASGPVGSAIIGAIRNMGIMAGIMPGNVRDWASLLSLHVAPSAAMPDPTMRMNRMV